jgi:hypothetical protein
MKILFSVLILFFTFNLAFPQDCGTTQCTSFKGLSNTDYKKQLDKFDAVFYGEIISQGEPVQPEKGFPYRLLKVKVLRTWKGIESKEVDI